MSTRLLSSDHALWFDRVRLEAYLRKHQPADLSLVDQILDYYRNRTEEMFQKMATDTQINPTRPWLEEVLPREHQHLAEHLLTEFHDREDELFQLWFRTYYPEATEDPGAVAASATAEKEVKAAIDDDKKEDPDAVAASAATEEEAKPKSEAVTAADVEAKAKAEALAAQERRRAAVRAKQSRQVEEKEEQEQEREFRREQKSDAAKAQAIATAQAQAAAEAAEAKAAATANVTDDEEEDAETEEEAAKKAKEVAAEKAAAKLALYKRRFKEVERVLQYDGKKQSLLVLGITAEANNTVMKQHYRMVAALVHPNKHTSSAGHPKATLAFQILGDAKDEREATPEERRKKYADWNASSRPESQQAPSAGSSEEEFCGYGNPKKKEPKPQPETWFGRSAGAEPQQETPFGRPTGTKPPRETPFGRSSCNKKNFRRPAGTYSSRSDRGGTKAKTKPTKKAQPTKRPKPTKRPTAAARAKAEAHQAASDLPTHGMFYVGVTGKGTPCQHCCRNCGEQFCSTRHKTFMWVKL